jgi:hypothetical protein
VPAGPKPRRRLENPEITYNLKMKLGIRPDYKNRYSTPSEECGSTKYKKN